MKKISIGKLRGLQQSSSDQATFTCLALDHRQNLRRAFTSTAHRSVSDQDLIHFKLEVAAALADLSTAVLFDPEYSAAQSIATGVLPGNTGLIVSLESTGYDGTQTARESHILPGWNVEKAKRMGASMVKLLVYYHPDSPTASMIESLVKQIADECIRHDLGLMLEPLSYSLVANEKLSSAEKRYVVTTAAHRLVIPGVDVLKAEFPIDIDEDLSENSWFAACEEISAASQAPWIVLSAAVDYEIYLHQVELACRAGASGSAVGRAVWQEAVSLEGKARLEFLNTIGRERLARLSVLCSELGKSINDFYSAEASSKWYTTY